MNKVSVSIVDRSWLNLWKNAVVCHYIREKPTCMQSFMSLARFIWQNIISNLIFQRLLFWVFLSPLESYSLKSAEPKHLMDCTAIISIILDFKVQLWSIAWYTWYHIVFTLKVLDYKSLFWNSRISAKDKMKNYLKCF